MDPLKFVGSTLPKSCAIDLTGLYMLIFIGPAWSPMANLQIPVLALIGMDSCNDFVSKSCRALAIQCGCAP